VGVAVSGVNFTKGVIVDWVGVTSIVGVLVRIPDKVGVDVNVAVAIVGVIVGMVVGGNSVVGIAVDGLVGSRKTCSSVTEHEESRSEVTSKIQIFFIRCLRTLLEMGIYMHGESAIELV
jgi:hypothetical protein